MSEHTPGPWTFSGNRSTAATVTAPRRLISPALVETYGAPETPEAVAICYGDSEIRKANARLIAAAPDLLAFAQAMNQWEADLILDNEAWDGGMAPTPTITEELWDRLMQLQAMRNAAIKKAKEARP